MFVELAGLRKVNEIYLVVNSDGHHDHNVEVLELAPDYE